jgi:hypothetical protein
MRCISLLMIELTIKKKEQQMEVKRKFNLKQASSKKVKPPPRFVLFGEPGVGKTTFGISGLKALLLALESGALGVDCARLPVDGKFQSWDDLIECVKMLCEEEHDYQWIVLDTVNSAEILCSKMICDRDFGGSWNGLPGQEGFNSFAKGDRSVAQEFRKLLELLDYLQQKKQIGIILLAHVGLHKQANMFGSDYQKLGGDLNKNTWNLICAWADQVGYACRDIQSKLSKGDAKAKAKQIGNSRWIMFEGGPGLDAKSRVGYEMPTKILLDWDEYILALNSNSMQSLIDQAENLMQISSQNIKSIVINRMNGKEIKDLPKDKIVSLINWLLMHEEEKQETETRVTVEI